MHSLEKTPLSSSIAACYLSAIFLYQEHIHEDFCDLSAYVIINCITAITSEADSTDWLISALVTGQKWQTIMSMLSHRKTIACMGV